jgi:mRNA-degrading endonuclease RelE of RelBE toxin-antitoxin system
MFKVLETDDFIFERNEILKELYNRTLSEKTVRNLFKKIKNKLLLIKENPEIFRIRESCFRIIPMNSYSILYKIDLKQKIIKIYSIVYSASNFQEYK